MTAAERMVAPMLEARLTVAREAGTFLGETERLILWLANGKPDTAVDLQQLGKTMSEVYSAVLRLEEMFGKLADVVRTAQEAGDITNQTNLRSDSPQTDRVLS